MFSVRILDNGSKAAKGAKGAKCAKVEQYFGRLSTRQIYDISEDTFQFDAGNLPVL